MDDRINGFLEALKNGLAGFPESETREAVAYYEEYISDALDEGESVEDILSRFEPPEKIAAAIMAETSIRRTKNSPGLKNYSNVLKYSRLLITRPMSLLFFSIFIFITYGMALLLFLGAIASAAAACVILPGVAYEALRIPTGFIAEILGTAGIGVFASALCILLAYGLFVLCRLFIRLSTGIVGRMLNKSGSRVHEKGGKESEISEDKPGKRSSFRWVPITCTIALAAGLTLSLASGLPVKMFMIFNSTEPSSIKTQQWEFNKADIKTISIKTAHSHIRLGKGDSEKILLTYGQPDWTEPRVEQNGGNLSFTEVSNGRMPFFSLVSIHENRTDVVLTLPAGFDPESLDLESRGGYIYINTADYNAKVKTYTGSIFVGANAAKAAGIKAVTATGVITSDGKAAGTRSSEGYRYEIPSRDGRNIDIETSQGSVFIE